MLQRWVKPFAAKRTDSCGDMEQLELMELILVSEHKTKVAAEQAAKAKRAGKDGWRYAVMSRRYYEARVARYKLMSPFPLR